MSVYALKAETRHVAETDHFGFSWLYNREIGPTAGSFIVRENSFRACYVIAKIKLRTTLQCHLAANTLKKLVGTRGFEPPTPTPPV